MSEWIVAYDDDGNEEVHGGLVRCKNCMHKDVLPDMYGIGTEALYCPVIEHYVEHNFFCKHGEVTE